MNIKNLDFMLRLLFFSLYRAGQFLGPNAKPGKRYRVIRRMSGGGNVRLDESRTAGLIWDTLVFG
jgi:hypothetical protein